MMFGIGEALWLGAFTVLSMLLCKKHSGGGYMTLLAVNYTLVNIFSGVFTQIESITAVGIYVFSDLLSFVMQKEDWTYRIIATMLLLLLPNANEYFVGYSCVLFCVLLARLFRERRKVYLCEWIVHIVVNTYTIFRSYIAATQGASTASLMGSIRTLHEKKYYWILIFGIVIAFLAALVYGKLHNTTVLAAVMVISILCSIWIGYLIYTMANALAARSFSMRFMNLVLPMALGMLCLLIWLFRINIEYSLAVMAITFLILSNVYDIKVSNAYYGYLVRINEMCKERTGFFTISETDLDQTFCWGWSLPQESFFAQCLQGETIIDSNMIQYFEIPSWEPFDSDNIDAYADMSKYGIEIDKQSFY